MFKHIFVIFISISVLISNINSKPLSPEVISYLSKDMETFFDYRVQYKYLNCKLLTYSRIKLFYEKETIDQYVNKTQNRGAFLDYLRDTMFKFCMGAYKANNMEIFETEQYIGWNEANTAWVDLNMTSLLANYTIIETTKKDL